MRSARNDDGFALATAVMLLAVMMGLGLGLLLLTDNQQRASAREQASESSFNVAEGALNAQVGQLARSWPGKKELALPSKCTSASLAESGCPSAGSMNAGYPNISPVPCKAGTTEAWGSQLANQWTTYVRDDVNVGGIANPYFESGVIKGKEAWDENKDGKLWVRSVGVIQCRVVTVVSLVSEQLVTVPFPRAAIAGNWFETSNTGEKTIVDTQGGEPQSGGVSMRCTGLTEAECYKYPANKPEQVKPPTRVEATPNPAKSEAQRLELRAAAQAEGHYYAAGVCPTSLEALVGLPAYVEGPCNLSFSGGVGNSSEKPGFLVLVNGTFSLNGSATFFGTIYAVNAQASSGVVVEVHGNGHVFGTVVVDGNGGMSFGSSGQGAANLTYSTKALEELKTFAGASPTRNSFRVLPSSQ
jgi:Tfp pilus assembly protein PilX